MRYVLLAVLGQVASLEFTSKEYNEDLDYKMKLKSIQSKFIESIPEKKFLAV